MNSMYRTKQRVSAALCALMIACTGTAASLRLTEPQSAAVLTASAFDTGSRIRVDINKNDGRKASYSKNANNWLLAEGSSASYSVGGVTFKLSNGGSVGGNVTGANNKKLQLQSQVYPRMTMDGAKIKDGDNGGVLKFEISGLSSGNHSLQMWHCNTDGYANSKLSISVNGKKVLTGVNCPTNVSNEDDAGISYVTFSGSSATILITPEGGGKMDVAWLNGFEIDGSDPVNGVSRMSPKDQETHLDRSAGLSWTAGKNAKSHNVYIGTDYNSVFQATTSSKEFKGNQTGTKFTLDDSYSSIPTYYWRVDEVSDSGTVKGAVYSFQINRLAFPTAEGYGRYARGGRGGYVYHVTNLNDSGEGSLRYGLETLKGARTVVFDVGGVIALKSVLCIPEDGGDVYVAGQTAPGDGITLINYDFGAMGADDVVIRDVRVRVGESNGKSTGGMGLGSCNYSIVDHCSISWATDEGFSSRSAANITFQWNIIGESLNNSVHYNAADRSDVERHAFAASIGGYTGSFHHNLLINNTGRNWSLAGAMEQDAVTYGGQLDIRNNVVYNWKDRTTDGGARRVQFVNNYYKAGPVSNTSLHLVSVDGNELNTSDMQMLYASGNMKVAQNGSTLIAASADEWSSGKAVCGNKGNNANASTIRSNSPWFESYVNTQTAEQAYASVIVNAGASVPAFDYIDSRYQKEVKNGTYTYTGSRDKLKGIIDTQNDAGGYPNSSNFKGGTKPTDTDGDGMPDAWESAHGLNPNNAADGAVVSLSGDDYTNLELYLNELAGDNVAFNGGKQGASFDTQYKYTLKNVGSGLYLNSADASPASGTNVQQGTERQTWLLADAGEGYYYIYSTLGNGSLCIDIPYGSADNGTSIGLWSNDESDARKIKLADNGDGTYTLCTKVSSDNSCLGVISGSKEAGADVIEWSCDGTDSQKWIVDISLDPINGTLIRDLTILDSKYYSSYAIDDSLAVGDLLFGDREVTYQEVPEALLGAETIVTPCDAKNQSGELAEFTAGADISVYVLLDQRVVDVQQAKPAWLSGWTQTDMTVKNDKDVVFYVYQKDVSAGETVSLGDNGTATSVVHYTVLALPQKAAETTTDPGDNLLVLGDADCNGSVDVLDAVMLARVTSEDTGTGITAQGKLNADCDQNGSIQAADLSLLLSYLAGNTNQLEIRS
ncbi:MAG: RICIN domain-containing protein [Oscillospiraceae bacterium]|nr:RICIN domain-containing protein [Oscillospiraceae bacterium]